MKERQLRNLKITDVVSMDFVVMTTNPPEAGKEDGGSTVSTNKHGFESGSIPQKQFLDCMKKLRKHALEICEMDIVDKKNYTNWNVSELKISGDVTLKQSRVIMTVTKYGESEYQEVEKLTAIIEDIIEEAWSYFDQNAQLDAFEQKLETNFVK